MAAERIAQGYVEIALNDRDALTGIRRVEREFNRAMHEMDRQSATADVDIELRELRKGLKQARKELDAFEKDEATVNLRADHKRLTSDLNNARREVRRLEGEGAHIDVEVDKEAYETFKAQLAAARAEVKHLDGERAQVEIDIDVEGYEDAKRKYAELEAREKQFERLRTNLIREVRREQRAAEMEEKRARSEQARMQREGMALSRAEAAAYKMDSDRTLAAMTEREKKLSEILKLQKEYAKLTDERERIAKRTPVRREDHMKVDLDAARVEAQMLLLKQRLEFLGSHPPVEIKADIDRRGLKRITGFFGDVGSLIARGAAGLQGLTLRIGPFTASIRQFAIALAFLGPTILDLTGALGSLIGVMGAGLSGALAVGTAGAVGFGLAVGGVALAVKPVINDLKIARQATDAYYKAVLKYGKGSDEAKKAQEQMNNVLKNVDPNAAAAAKGLSKMSKQWGELTAPTRKSFGAVIADGVKTAESLMPNFAKRTNEFSGMLEDGFKSAFEYLRNEGGKAIDDIQANFNRATPAMLRGLGGFGEGFINLLREASNYLPELMRGFERLGDRFRDWTKGDTFTETIRRWVDSARDLSRFFGAATRVLVHFFGAGVGPGREFVQVMTDALNKWDALLTTDSSGATEFFERAVKGTRALWNAIAPLGAAFIEWANNLSPFVTGLLQGVAAVTQIVSKLTELIGMGGALSTLGATIGAMWAIGKIGTFVSNLSRVMLGWRGVETAANRAAVAQARAGAATMGPGGAVARGGSAARVGAAMTSTVPIGTAANAGRTATQITRMSRAASAARGAMSGLGAMSVGVASPIAGVGVAAAAAGVGLYLYANRTRDFEKAQKSAEKSTASYVGLVRTLPDHHLQLAQTSLSLSQAQDQLTDSQKRVNTLEKHNKTNTDQYRQALLDQHQAQLNVSALQKERIKLNNEEVQSAKKLITETQNAVRERQRQVREAEGHRGTKEIMDDLRARLQSPAGLRDADGNQFKSIRDYINKGHHAMSSDERKNLNYLLDAQQALNGAYKEAADAQNNAVLADANRVRALKMLPPLANSAAKSMRALRDAAGTKTMRQIATQFATGAGSVARSATKAMQEGASSTRVMKVIGDTRNADIALARLRNIDLPIKTLNIVEEGGDKAIKKLERIKGEKLTPKQQEIAEEGGEEALKMLRRIRDHKLMKKVQRIAETGGPEVMETVNKIDNKKIRNKAFEIAARGNAMNVVNSLLGNLQSLVSRTWSTTVSIGANISASARRWLNKVGLGGFSGGVLGGNIPGFASGGMPNAASAHAQAARNARHNSNRGLKVTRPTYLTGEEGPQHPEFVIATNPAYRASNLAYWTQAGHELGVPGFARGGMPVNRSYKPQYGWGGPQLSVATVRALFEYAGLSPKMASMMAQIVHGESNYRPGAVADDGGLGLTQITPFLSGGRKNWGDPRAYRLFERLGGKKGMLNPINNVRMAVWLLKHGGLKNWHGTKFLNEATASDRSVRGTNPGIWANITRQLRGSGNGTVMGDQNAVSWAKGMLGHFAESAGSNRGPELDKLQREFGFQAAAWCAMFVSKALQKGGLKGIKTASVNQLVQWAKNREKGLSGVSRTSGKAKAGDVWVDSTQTGHTGLVVRVDRKAGVVHTIEGNTTAGKVARRTHKFGEGFVLGANYPGGQKGRGGYGGDRGDPIVPGDASPLYADQAARLENRLAMLGADTDDTVRFSNKYVGLQIQKFQLQAGRIKELRAHIKSLNARLAGPLRKSKRESLLQARTGYIQEIGQLRTSNKGISTELNRILTDRANPFGNGQGHGSIELQQAVAGALYANDPVKQREVALRDENYYAWAIQHAPKDISQADLTALYQAYGQARQTREGLDMAIAQQPDANKQQMFQLYQAGRMQALNPITNAGTMAALNTPDDFTDDLKPAEDALTFWQAEWTSAIESGFQDRIDWAAQGLAAARQATEDIRQKIQEQTVAPLNTALAISGLTFNLNDDLAATQNLVGYWNGEYQAALASGVQSRIQNAAQMLSQYQEQAKQLAKQVATQPYEAQLALAQLTDTFEDDKSAVTSLLSLHEAWLEQAKAIGDYASIIEEAGQVKQLRDQLEGINNTIAQQIGDFNAARLTLFRSMGSNNSAPGVAQKIINVTNHYKTMPEDPHTWSKAVGFELDAAL